MKKVCLAVLFSSFAVVSMANANRDITYVTCTISASSSCPNADNFYCLDGKRNDVDCDSSSAKTRVCVYGNDNPSVPANCSN